MGERWTDDEVDLLRENYHSHGPGWDGWDKALPDRTYRAIREKAYALGLRCDRPSAFRTYGGAPDLSAALAVDALSDATRLRLAFMLEGVVA